MCGSINAKNNSSFPMRKYGSSKENTKVVNRKSICFRQKYLKPTAYNTTSYVCNIHKNCYIETSLL